MSAPRSVWLVTYEGADVSDDIAPMVVSIDYTDNISPKPPEKDKDGKEKPPARGEAEKAVSDELSLTVEDRTGRWRAGWWPAKGDRIAAQLGYEGQPLLQCGMFEIDEVELTGAPDTASIRAQSTPMSDALRTEKSEAYEDTTLRAIIERLAAELELELVGEVEELPIARVTQGKETTLAFLRRMAGEYGYAFAVRPPQLVFYGLAALAADPPVATIRRVDLLGYRLKSAVHGTYAACICSWFDPRTAALREVRVDEQFVRQRIIVDVDLGEEGGGGEGTAPVVHTRLLQVGVQGDDVRGWQSWITSRGFTSGPIDGIFGPLTRGGTTAFQGANGLVVDGIVGPETTRVAVEQGYGSGTTGTEAGEGGTRAEAAGAILRIDERVETVEQATVKATAALAAANRITATGSLSLAGAPALVAGRNVELVGMGRFNGKYQITKSAHRMARSGGYTTELEVEGV